MNPDINSNTTLLGLLGHPVGHSRSPFIYNSLASYFGHDLVYLCFDVEPDDLAYAVRGGLSLGVKGFNVTVPHKQDVRLFLSGEDEDAGKVGAVNTLKRTEEGWYGYNTDLYGFMRSLDSDGIKLKDKNVVVLGAGGASRAIICAVLKCGAKKLVIFNRTYEKARALADEFGAAFKDTEVTSFATEAALLAAMDNDGGGWIAVNTTSLGMYPNTGEKLISDKKFYELCDTGVDIIFNPAKTAFMEAMEAGKEGNRAYNGLKMLLYQGLRSYEIWNDVSVPDDVAEDIYKKMKDM
ncbi:MAG: shikimate dehydrogenase [Lachnospiraceae bacterium]|nr:shikimate dehydrogenase [Lachnospiraceae bacterium]